MIKIEKSQTIDDIEKYYGPLYRGEARELTVPTDLDFAEFGGAAALIQLLITWAKNQPGRTLLIHTTEEHKIDHALLNLALTHHGLIAMLLADRVLTADRKPLSLRAFNTTLRHLDKERQKHLLPPEAAPESLIMSVDHLSSKYRYVPGFYQPCTGPRGRLKRQADFVSMASELIRIRARYTTARLPPTKDLRVQLGTILYELFKNTHMWAQHGIGGEFIPRSIRGVRLGFVRNSALGLARQPEPIRTFITKAQENGPRDFIEVSLFDSGPGLAARGLRTKISDDIEISKEYQALVSCLKAHVSSSQKSHHGIGLLEVMRTLTNAEAFLRLRSGRLSLIRDFVQNRLQDENDLWLFDSATNSLNLTPFDRAEGLLVTMIMPVRVQ